jgi:hypothetical protein
MIEIDPVQMFWTLTACYVAGLFIGWHTHKIWSKFSR